MKFSRMLGLLALVAASLMAIAASAAATTYTSPAGTAYTGEIALANEGHIVLQNPIAKIECEATVVEAKVEKHGVGVTAQGALTELKFPSCTNSWHVTTVAPGAVEVHLVETSNGTLTSNGMTLEATRLGITCRYTTSNADIGKFTSGNPGTLHLEGAFPFHGGSPLCGSGSFKLNGSYKVTVPTPFFISE